MRFLELPDGTSKQVDAGGREINGLCYNKSNTPHYSADPKTGKRGYRATSLEKAVEGARRVNIIVEPSNWTPEFWAIKETEYAELETPVSEQLLPMCPVCASL